MRARDAYLAAIETAFASHAAVALLGPRQCGKYTLARMFAAAQRQGRGGEVTFFDLEDPTDLARLESPTLALADLTGLVVIDEIQRRPDLFPVLRVLIDRQQARTQYLILGSASRDLIRQSSETLAGRLAYIELTPFNSREVGDLRRLWTRGGFPRAYLAARNEESVIWRKGFIRTFLEQDIPNLGFQVAPAALRRFWVMLAHYHGGICNYSAIGRSMDVADTTVRKYLDILTGTFMVRALPPWSEAIGKRQVKAPKIYFRDSGIFHSLLGVADMRQLQAHPALGASWEGFAAEEVIRAHRATDEETYFWATHGGAELDLLIVRDGRRLGFEFKHTDAPRVTKSMLIAQQDLKLDSLTVVYPGTKTFLLTRAITAASLADYLRAERDLT